jgi:hypothetical protein
MRDKRKLEADDAAAVAMVTCGSYSISWAAENENTRSVLALVDVADTPTAPCVEPSYVAVLANSTVVPSCRFTLN